jgi:hypothetical protein
MIGTPSGVYSVAALFLRRCFFRVGSRDSSGCSAAAGLAGLSDGGVAFGATGGGGAGFWSEAGTAAGGGVGGAGVGGAACRSGGPGDEGAVAAGRG